MAVVTHTDHQSLKLMEETISRKHPEPHLDPAKRRTLSTVMAVVPNNLSSDYSEKSRN